MTDDGTGPLPSGGGLIARGRRALQRKFVRDTLVLQAGSLVQSGSYFLTSVLTARSLGDVQLGRWGTIREMSMFIFFLVSMGLTNAAVSVYSRAHGQGDQQRALLALASMLKLGVIVSVIVAFAGTIYAPDIAERIYGDREVGQLAGVLCFGCMGEVFRGLTLAVLNGSRQMTRYVVFDAGTNVLRLLLVGGALLWERSPRSLACAFLVHALASGLLGLLAYRRTGRVVHANLAPPPLGRVLAAIPRAPLRLVLGVSSWLAAGKALNAIVPRLGLLLIPALAVSEEQGFADNGLFQVAMVLNMVMGGFVGAISTNLLPTLGHRMGQADLPMSAMGRELRRVAMMAGSGTAAATLLSLPVMWGVLHLYGQEYQGAFTYFALLASGNLLLGFTVVAEPFAIYSGTLRWHMLRSVALATLAAGGIAWGTAVGGAQGAALAGGLARATAVVHLIFMWRWFASHRESPAA